MRNNKGYRWVALVVMGTFDKNEIFNQPAIQLGTVEGPITGPSSREDRRCNATR